MAKTRAVGARRCPAGVFLLPVVLMGATGGWAGGLPDRTIPQTLGFNVHITGPDEQWDKIRESGVKFIRTDFPWRRIESVKGEYDFSTYERMLDSLDKRGLRALFILDYRNPLYPDPETSDEGREAYAKWAAASAGRFKGRNVIWEIWNEPNVKFWHGRGNMNSAEFAEEYVALVNKTVPAMRAADPDSYILGGSVSCLWVKSFQWIDEVFKRKLLQTGINALSVHPYGFPRPEFAVEGGGPEEGYGRLRDRMEKIGAKGFPVVNSEVGYKRDSPTVGPPDLAPEHQAMLFVRTYLLDLMCGMGLTIWYNWDGDGGYEVRGEAPGRPVYRAIKNLVAELTGYRYAERLPAGSTRDYVLAFENASKGRKIVAWTTPKERKDTPDKAEAHAVAIPAASPSGVIAVQDLFGKVVPAKAEGGGVTLTLTGSPQYIDCGSR